MANSPTQSTLSPKRPLDPFRRAVLRGLAVLLPPLLTIVIFLWVGNTVITYMLEPMERVARVGLMRYTTDIQPRSAEATLEPQDGSPVDTYTIDGTSYAKAADGKYVPLVVYEQYESTVGRAAAADAETIYQEYIDHEYLQRQYVIPVFLGVLLLVLYLLGKFLAAGVGRFLWSQLENLIKRLPLVSNVYSSVKQVTDFMFTDTELKATRVVAIEYPRRGIWTLAMVTGESFLDIRAAANEPVLSVLVPTSPMPFTGFTMTVRKSETIDLDITIDQALQFIVSCGVVVPSHQMSTEVDARDRILSVNVPSSYKSDTTPPQED